MGRKKLLSRVKSGELVLSSTDKSGKIAVWTRQLYIRAAQDHISKDTQVDWEYVNKVQNQANGLATTLCSAFMLGSKQEGLIFSF